MSKPKLLNHAPTHDDSRKRLCVLCLQKYTNFVKITDVLKTKIEKLTKLKINVNIDTHLPSVICGGCKLKLYRKCSDSDISNIFILPDYSKFKGQRVLTRSNSDKKCDCYLCDLVRKPTKIYNFAKKIEQSAEQADPTKGVKSKTTTNALRTNVVCSKCLAEIGPGKNHVCSFKTYLNNVKSHVTSKLSPKESDQLISTLLKNKIEQKNTSCNKKLVTNQSLPLAQRRGRPMNVVINPNNTSDKSLISIDKVAEIQNELNLSFRATKGMVSSLRSATKKQKLFESNLEKKLLAKNHIVDKYFEFKMINFVYTKAEVQTQAPQITVYCNNVESFINSVMEKRKVNKAHLKFGIDGGNGFLKLCCSVVELLDDEDKNSSLKTNKKLKIFKDSGVKKLLILAIAASTQENYDNVSKLWSLLEMNKFKGTFAADLKLINILLGIMPHSSSYPCAWCNSHKNELHLCGVYRTIRDLLKNYEDWKNAGAVKKDAKKFKSCINPPVFSNTPKDTLVLDLVPPPELHLMLGVVNTIMSYMLIECKLDATEWIEKCHVQQEVTRNGTSFTGNSCKILLNKIDDLRAKCSLESLKYVQVLEDFKNVVHDCFSYNLRPTYKLSCERFRKRYLVLNRPVTPKIHAVFFHVVDFCEKTGKGLGFYSEQPFESVHHDFNETWKRHKVRANHPEFGNRLSRAVCDYNSHHV